MKGTKLMDVLKNELKNSHLASNVFFSFVLTVLEKLVEIEFSCPCISFVMNALFASLFFILPGILSSVLMACVRGYKCEKRAMLCCIPFIVWLTLVFLDGQYFACAMTDWSGTYQTVPQSAHQKWCKPDNTSTKTSEELLRTTQFWFTVSQFIGMGFVGLLILTTAVYPKVRKCFRRNGPPYNVVNENQERSENANCQEIELQNNSSGT